jgi:N-acetylmuramoyl-L-alanine amidase
MKIKDHRLIGTQGRPVAFQPSPNYGAVLQPVYLVMHYTAGRNAKESIRWLCSPSSRASAHLVVARDGAVTQLVPFDRVAWHAGASSWEGRTALNNHSIGIELDNAGRLTRHGRRWRAWFGTEYPEDQVIEARHKHEVTVAGWHLYPPEQIESALEIASLLVATYGLRDIVGHDDISPGRKADPGPAFPMDSFRSHVFGRGEESAATHRTIAALNIRSGPGTQYATLPGSPLPKGTPVAVLQRESSWWRVDVLTEVKGLMDLQGWVHHGFLERVDTAPPAARGEPVEVVATRR